MVLHVAHSWCAWLLHLYPSLRLLYHHRLPGLLHHLHLGWLLHDHLRLTHHHLRDRSHLVACSLNHTLNTRGSSHAGHIGVPSHGLEAGDLAVDIVLMERLLLIERHTNAMKSTSQICEIPRKLSLELLAQLKRFEASLETSARILGIMAALSILAHVNDDIDQQRELFLWKFGKDGITREELQKEQAVSCTKLFRC